MNRKTTLILLSFFLLLGLYAVWYQSSKGSAAAQATPTAEANPKVWGNVTVDQVTDIQITVQASGKKVALSKDAQGNWQVTAPETKAADPAQISNLTYNIANLATMASLPTVSDLAPFGLVTPAYTLEAKLATGTQLKLVIGDKIPTGNGYYVMRGGETKPLAVPDYSLSPFIGLIDNPPYFVPTATPMALPATPTP